MKGSTTELPVKELGNLELLPSSAMGLESQENSTCPPYACLLAKPDCCWAKWLYQAASSMVCREVPLWGWATNKGDRACVAGFLKH